MPEFPTGGRAGKGVTAGFDVARFRKGEETSVAGLTGTKNTAETKLSRQELLAKYPIIDALFEQDPELRALLDKYLDPKSKMTLEQFKIELGQAKYNFKYADIIKDRLAKKAIYDRLGPDATGQTDYELEVNNIRSVLESTAVQLGAVLTDQDFDRIASQIYLAGTEARPLVLERALTPYIKLGVDPKTGRPTLGGAAGTNYRTLLGVAAANGISETMVPKILGVNTVDEALRKIAEGESIDTYSQIMRNYAMNGRSDYVKNLLAQGITT